MSIVDAIINLLKYPLLEFSQEYVNESNRANSMGETLEEYLKDLFAGTMEITDSQERLRIHKETYSWLGNQNNPPDFILRGGDAIEVKKIENPDSALALNSSYPKHKLYADSHMITKACRNCEEWKVKDILYAVGVVGKDKKTLSSLAFVYGEDYAASREIYERIRLKIKDGILTIPNIEFDETTKELGRVNRVDPLGITYLRIRGMWGIENPFKVFEYLFQRDKKRKFNFMAIIGEKKWRAQPRNEELRQLVKANKNAKLTKVEIKDPDNPAKLKKAYLVTYQI
ncbi:MAG: NgoPII family restriction endonuclease [Candidatus Riflebacteria bacterium]|nr:NgoPII family restriction endonuclease [Candidatus Riflebacteria bacterium]